MAQTAVGWEEVEQILDEVISVLRYEQSAGAQPRALYQQADRIVDLAATLEQQEADLRDDVEGVAI